MAYKKGDPRIYNPNSDNFFSFFSEGRTINNHIRTQD